MLRPPLVWYCYCSRRDSREVNTQFCQTSGVWECLWWRWPLGGILYLNRLWRILQKKWNSAQLGNSPLGKGATILHPTLMPSECPSLNFFRLLLLQWVWPLLMSGCGFYVCFVVVVVVVVTAGTSHSSCTVFFWRISKFCKPVVSLCVMISWSKLWWVLQLNSFAGNF